jgi:hypothetical protein
MGTRSRIGIEDMETGAVASTYSHWDGYPSGVGKTLLDHYQDRDKVEALVALGYVSSLKDTVEETAADAANKGKPANDTSAETYFERATDGWEEYAYLFRQGVWFVVAIGGDAGPMLVNAKDPDGAAPARWTRIEHAIAEETGGSYAIVTHA